MRQFLEIIQKHLRTPNSKRRNNNIAAALLSIIYYLCQLGFLVIYLVHTVAISRFRNNKIGTLKLLRVFQNRRARLPHIASKNQLRFFTVFFGKNLCHCRTYDMSCNFKFNFNSWNNFKFLIKITYDKTFKRAVSLINRIQRLNQFTPGTHALTVSKLCIRFVDMRTVWQQNSAQRQRCFGAVNRAFVALRNQLWYQAAMVNMRMC